jgi:hypothetical protein
VPFLKEIFFDKANTVTLDATIHTFKRGDNPADRSTGAITIEVINHQLINHAYPDKEADRQHE